MKKKLWIIPVTVAAALALLVGAYWVLRLGFDMDILDRSGWNTAQDGSITYLDYYGKPLTHWQELEGKHYYFSPEGTLQTLWQDIEGTRYYLGSDGAARTHWQTIDGNRYYFNADGAMVTGWQTLEDVSYYFTEDGMLQTGFFTLDDTLFYANQEGKVLPGWFASDGKRYYCLEDGSLAVGWADIASHRYYFNTDGSLYTGWLEQDGSRYYLKDNGVMAIGRITLDDTNHFFTSQGKYVLLVNAWNPVPASYDPQLVDLEHVQVSATAFEALQAMVAAGRAAGHPCSMTSVYRSIEVQRYIWNRNVNTYMKEGGYSYSAACALTGQSVMIPGHSEHQTGLAVDFNNSQTGSIQWLQENCWDYGFILRYPPDKIDKTGIIYEPWHYRYVGKELALELKELGLCMEEYMDMLTEQENQKAA